MQRVPNPPLSCAWLLATLACGCQDAPTHADSSQLQGYWANEDSSVYITGNSLYFYERDDHWFQTEFTLPPKTAPRQLHATILRDSSGEDDEVGSVVGAIYKVEDETLTLVAYGAEDEPPESFDDDPKTLGRYELRRGPPQVSRTRPPSGK